MNISQILKLAAEKLKNSGIENPAMDARILLVETLEKDTAYIIGHSDEILEEEQITRYNSYISRRAKREPVAHIIGKKDFWKNEFFVCKDVLSPRPDSETLIEAVLSLYPDKSVPINILEFGVGSGCLIISLLQEFPNSKGVGADICQKALAITKKNAINMGCELELITSNWGADINGSFDLIISNPPYITESEIDDLQPEITRYEPHLALSGGVDGLRAFLPLFESIDKLLKKDGYAIVEIGKGQENEVISIAKEYNLVCIKKEKDISQIIRVLIFNRG